jgi:hypothetical protein
VPSSWKKMMMTTISQSLRNERAYDVSIPPPFDWFLLV